MMLSLLKGRFWETGFRVRRSQAFDRWVQNDPGWETFHGTKTNEYPLRIRKLLCPLKPSPPSTHTQSSFRGRVMKYQYSGSLYIIEFEQSHELIQRPGSHPHMTRHCRSWVGKLHKRAATARAPHSQLANTTDHLTDSLSILRYYQETLHALSSFGNNPTRQK
jgi:hypothetical protein